MLAQTEPESVSELFHVFSCRSQFPNRRKIDKVCVGNYLIVSAI